MKTNAARILDGLKIAYRLIEYPVDETDLGAENVAAKVGMPPAQVFKTLVARGNRSGILLACIPGSAELDLKALANVSGNKNVDMVPLKEVQPLTGYIRGGVSPVGTKKRYPTYFDATVADWPEIAVSAGVRGCQMVLAPAGVLAATGGRTGAIAREKA